MMIQMTGQSYGKVNKCCDEGEIFYKDRQGCGQAMPGDPNWTPPLPHQEVASNFLSLYLSGSIPNCTDIHSLEPDEDYYLLDDGQLHHPGYEQ